jgi:hypothetical protein
MLYPKRNKQNTPEGGKHVILFHKEGEAFLSVYDVKMRPSPITCTSQSDQRTAPQQRDRSRCATISIPTTRACCWSIQQAGPCLFAKQYGSHG